MCPSRRGRARGGRARAKNRGAAPIHTIPVAELERIVGIELLPSLSQRQKERMLALPNIRQRKTRP